MLKRAFILFVILVCFLVPSLAAAWNVYLLPESGYRKLTKAEIRQWDLDTMPYLFDEILARYGYDFIVGGKFENYFYQQDWYRPNLTWNNQRDVYNKLTSIEWYNIDLIKEVRKEKEKNLDDSGRNWRDVVYGWNPTPNPVPGQSEALNYFREIAFDAEYKNGNTQFPLRRWETPIRIRVYGSPTNDDLQTLDRHIADLNNVNGMPYVSRVTSNENIALYFVPVDSMKYYVSDYVPGNWGFFYCWWNSAQQLTYAQIAIATDVTNQQQRNHLILEEFTQALGMMQDSYQYDDSIFYGNWTEVQQLSALDWKVVQMTYSPLLKAGMSETEAVRILSNYN